MSEPLKTFCAYALLILTIGIAPGTSRAACSAAPTNSTGDGLLKFSNPPAYGNAADVPVAAGELVYDSTATAFKYCDGVSWKTFVAPSPAGSSGSVQFNASNAFTGDTSLFWDNTNKFLGIGTATPATPLDVSGALRLGNDTGSCATAKTGALKYVSGNSFPWQYCNGSAWTPFDVAGRSPAVIPSILCA